MRLHLDLIEREHGDFFWFFTYWRQPIPLYVAAMVIVIRREIRRQLVQLSFAENDEP